MSLLTENEKTSTDLKVINFRQLLNPSPEKQYLKAEKTGYHITKIL